ncbi:MAG: amidohydrolase [Clostridia bacterium]|nr:amidohydrolase [Clostridia bacterium]
MILIKNANVITMEGQNYPNGYIIIDNNCIKSVGNMTELPCSVENFDEAFDAEGAMALPGFIDAHCHIGMWEEGAGSEGSDGNEATTPVTPELRAIDSVNPADMSFSEALASGVTTVVTGPGSANVIGGQFAALKTAGRWVDEMIIKEPIAVKAALGENPKKVYGGKKESPATRMASAAVLRKALFSAKEYALKWDAYHNGERKDRPEFDFKMETLAQVIRGILPLKVHIHRADDIATAIRIADEFGIKITLEHCTEGHLILPLLKEKNLPIILGPTLGSRSKPELKNMSFDIYKAFEDADIPFSIMTDHPEIPIDRLYLCAALAHQSGIKKETALAAITINAAKHVGLENRIGSLASGKDADIVIMSGELFTLNAKVKAVFLNGQQMI